MTYEEAIQRLIDLRREFVLDVNGMIATEAAITVLEALTTERPIGRWISVAERLPEIGDTYLVTIEYKGEVIGVDSASYSPVDGYIDGRWETFNDWKEDEDMHYHVTAWMELPKPYRGDKE